MAILRSLLLLPMCIFIASKQLGQAGDGQDKGSPGSQRRCLFKVGSGLQGGAGFTGILPKPSHGARPSSVFSPVRALSSHIQAPGRAVSRINLAASVTAF